MERAYSKEAMEPRESFMGLLKQLATSSADMVRNEIALITQEAKDKAKALSAGAIMITIAGLVGFIALMALFAAAIIGLSAYMSAALASLIIGAALALVAGVFVLTGINKLKQAVPKGTDKHQTGSKAFLKEVKNE